MLNEIIVDVFAGGGGASSGIACAVGRSVDVAIDHDPAAIVMHRANHPHTKHWQAIPERGRVPRKNTAV